MNFNPYAAPAPPSPPPPGGSFEPVATAGHSAPQPFAASEVVGAAWERFKENAGLLIGVLVVTVLVRAPFMFAPAYLLKTTRMTGVEFRALGLACSLLDQVVEAYVGVGFARIGLEIVRREVPRFGDLFVGKGAGRNIGLGLGLGSSTTVPSLVLIVAMLSGDRDLFSIAERIDKVLGVLALVPNVLLWLAVSQATYFIADKDMSLGDAVRASLAATRGKRTKIFLASLLGGLLFVAGAMACGVGLFVTGPVFLMIYPVIYARLTGQDPAYAGSGGPGGGDAAPGAGWGGQSPP